MKASRVARFCLGAFCAVLLSACETNPNSAFPTAQAVAATSAGRDADVKILARGRKIFTTACTECHVARPIAKLSVAQWRHTVAVMAPRAGLTTEDRAAVEAYVVAARRSIL